MKGWDAARCPGLGARGSAGDPRAAGPRCLFPVVGSIRRPRGCARTMSGHHSTSPGWCPAAQSSCSSFHFSHMDWKKVTHSSFWGVRPVSGNAHWSLKSNCVRLREALRSRSCLGFAELEQVLVESVLERRGQTVRGALVELQDRALDELVLEQARGFVRPDLGVGPLDDGGRYGERLQVLGWIGFGA